MAEDTKGSKVDFLNNITDTPEVFKEEPKKEVEEKEIEQEVDEKPVPFHKDPKVQRFIDRQVEKALKERPSAEQQFRKDVVEDINLPPSFIKLVGNDTDEKKQVLKDLSDYFGSLKGEARKEFLAEMEQQQRQQVEQDRQAQEELDSSFEEIEETYNVDLSSNTATAGKMRSDFIDYIRKIAPKNQDGEVTAFPDLMGAFEDFQERSKRVVQPSRAKELASRGLTRSNDTSTAAPQGRSWKDVDKFFSKLKENNN